MLGLSYGEVFLILGATIVVIGPKDVPRVARAAGRLAGRAVGYVQGARGQMEHILHQSQANQIARVYLNSQRRNEQ
jgi:Sec-independent protein translocase protein TatA